MRIPSIGYALSGCVAAALLAGCGGSQPPIGAPGVMQPSRTIAADAERGGSWMLPQVKSQDLLYVADYATQAVYVYSYPQGKLVATLTGFKNPQGLCADKSGDVFVADYDTGIIEYAHGGKKPIEILTDPDGSPVACSVDPTSGNLAVSIETGSTGAVSIYKNAKGTPKTYFYSKSQGSNGCSYDNVGDLFFEVEQLGSDALVELPRGGKTFTNITVNKTIGGNEIQWDGKHLAIGDSPTNIYRFTINGSQGKRVGITRLESNNFPVFSILGSTVTAAYPNGVALWKYPEGGLPTKIIKNGAGGSAFPTSITVSVGSSH